MRNTFLVGLAAVSAFAATVLDTKPASAQLAPGVEPGYAASSFEPSERGSDWFAHDANDYRGQFRLALGVVGDYSYRGVVGGYNANDTIHASVLRNQVFLHAGASLVLWERLRLGVSVPLQVFADGHVQQASGIAYIPPTHDQSVGDIRTSADVRVAGQYGDPISLAVGASLFIPVGQRESFTGDDVTRFTPHVNIAGDIGMFAYSLKGGYELRPLRVKYLDTRLGSGFDFGVAAGVRLLDKKILIGPEAYGRTIVSNDDGEGGHDTPLEILLGAHFKVGGGFRVNAGAGTFLVKGYGAPVARTLLGLEWAPDPEKSDRDQDGIPDDEDACPDAKGPHTDDPKTNGCPPPPPSDRDHDSVFDNEDACPDVPGIRTSDPKTNGCPSDRDNDTVYDTEDACPDVPGVRTDDPKTNGCPSDRDKDGILDKDDACPDVAGIKTNDPKTNGCPDTDRDKDGIVNDEDACPDEAGPKSNDPKTSGCPRVFIKAGLIQILEQPKFAFNKADINKESDSLLTEVAKVMSDHAEIKLVNVQGHTDNVGTAVYNKKLSQERAESVVKWLSGHGVAKERLKATGMGLEKPLVPNDTEANRALNRRVEFHIEEQEQKVKEMVKTLEGEKLVKPPTPPPAPAPKP